MLNQENFTKVLKFMPQSQALCFLENLQGIEQEHFKGVAECIYKTIISAPALYQTDGQGESVKPILHYFGGSVDIYITEIDQDTHELYGYTSLGLGYLESGYIDLSYIFSALPLLNLDFNFEPKTIAEYKQIHK